MIIPRVQKYYYYYISLVAARLVDSNSIQASKAQTFQHISGIRINLDGLSLQSRNLGYEIQSSLSLFFLQFQRNTTDGSLGNSAHQMSSVTSNLVTHALGRQDGNIVHNALVGVKVQRQTRVVLFDNGTSRSLDSFGTDTLEEKEKNK